MNAAILVLFCLAWLIFAYFWYGRIIQKKVVFSDDSNITPSNEINDGLDYVPTNPTILFGHHFSAIAGAGPIVGPLLAFLYFGWLPAMLWIIIGSVFIGAVHDYTSLMISIRHKGISIVEISNSVISSRARAIFAIFVWLTLMLVQAIFADLTAQTLVNDPTIVMPTFGLIFVALLFGYLIYRKGMNVALGTIISIALLVLLIIAGNNLDKYPALLELFKNTPKDIWLILIFIYCLLASILPVWVLLQPRDYLAMYILIIGLAIGTVGIIVLHPTITAPSYLTFFSNKGPLFPILFITIACGAVSGFHSLVASGTSSKQIKKESQAKFIGYGSMLTEAALAILVIAMAASVLNWDSSNTSASNNFFYLMKQGANIAFGTSLGITTQSIGIPLAIGTSYGILMLNAFILTSLDASSRLSRYIVQETIGAKYGGVFKNRVFASAISLIFAYILCLSDSYSVIWPVFGAANQLTATFALFVVTVYFLGFKATKKYTLIPAIIMLLITETAFIYQIFWEYLPQKNWMLIFLSALLFVLGIVVAIEVFRKINKN